MENCGQLRFLKADGREGLVVPLPLKRPCTIGTSHDAVIRLKVAGYCDRRNIICEIVNENGFAIIKLRSVMPVVFVNCKKLLNSEVLVHNDIIKMFDKTIRYENPKVTAAKVRQLKKDPKPFVLLRPNTKRSTYGYVIPVKQTDGLKTYSIKRIRGAKKSFMSPCKETNETSEDETSEDETSEDENMNSPLKKKKSTVLNTKRSMRFSNINTTNTLQKHSLTESSSTSDKDTSSEEEEDNKICSFPEESEGSSCNSSDGEVVKTEQTLKSSQKNKILYQEDDESCTLQEADENQSASEFELAEEDAINITAEEQHVDFSMDSSDGSDLDINSLGGNTGNSSFTFKGNNNHWNENYTPSATPKKFSMSGVEPISDTDSSVEFETDSTPTVNKYLKKSNSESNNTKASKNRRSLRIKKTHNDYTQNLTGVKKNFATTSRTRRLPKNNLRNIRGIKKRWEARKDQKSPTNNVTQNVSGIKTHFNRKLRRSPLNYVENHKKLLAMLKTLQQESITSVNDFNNPSTSSINVLEENSFNEQSTEGRILKLSSSESSSSHISDDNINEKKSDEISHTSSESSLKQQAGIGNVLEENSFTEQSTEDRILKLSSSESPSSHISDDNINENKSVEISPTSSESGIKTLFNPKLRRSPLNDVDNHKKLLAMLKTLQQESITSVNDFNNPSTSSINVLEENSFNEQSAEDRILILSSSESVSSLTSDDDINENKSVEISYTSSESSLKQQAGIGNVLEENSFTEQSTEDRILKLSSSESPSSHISDDNINENKSVEINHTSSESSLKQQAGIGNVLEENSFNEQSTEGRILKLSSSESSSSLIFDDSINEKELVSNRNKSPSNDLSDVRGVKKVNCNRSFKRKSAELSVWDVIFNDVDFETNNTAFDALQNKKAVRIYKNRSKKIIIDNSHDATANECTLASLKQPAGIGNVLEENSFNEQSTEGRILKLSSSESSSSHISDDNINEKKSDEISHTSSESSLKQQAGIGNVLEENSFTEQSTEDRILKLSSSESASSLISGDNINENKSVEINHTSSESSLKQQAGNGNVLEENSFNEQSTEGRILKLSSSESSSSLIFDDSINEKELVSNRNKSPSNDLSDVRGVKKVNCNRSFKRKSAELSVWDVIFNDVDFQTNNTAFDALQNKKAVCTYKNRSKKIIIDNSHDATANECTLASLKQPAGIGNVLEENLFNEQSTEGRILKLSSSESSSSHISDDNINEKKSDEISHTSSESSLKQQAGIGNVLEENSFTEQSTEDRILKLSSSESSSSLISDDNINENKSVEINHTSSESSLKQQAGIGNVLEENSFTEQSTEDKILKLSSSESPSSLISDDNINEKKSDEISHTSSESSLKHQASIGNVLEENSFNEQSTEGRILKLSSSESSSSLISDDNINENKSVEINHTSSESSLKQQAGIGNVLEENSFTEQSTEDKILKLSSSESPSSLISDDNINEKKSDEISHTSSESSLKHQASIGNVLEENSFNEQSTEGRILKLFSSESSSSLIFDDSINKKELVSNRNKSPSNDLSDVRGVKKVNCNRSFKRKSAELSVWDVIFNDVDFETNNTAFDALQNKKAVRTYKNRSKKIIIDNSHDATANECTLASLKQPAGIGNVLEENSFNEQSTKDRILKLSSCESPSSLISDDNVNEKKTRSTKNNLDEPESSTVMYKNANNVKTTKGRRNNLNEKSQVLIDENVENKRAIRNNKNEKGSSTDKKVESDDVLQLTMETDKREKIYSHKEFQRGDADVSNTESIKSMIITRSRAKKRIATLEDDELKALETDIKQPKIAKKTDPVLVDTKKIKENKAEVVNSRGKKKNDNLKSSLIKKKNVKNRK